MHMPVGVYNLRICECRVHDALQASCRGPPMQIHHPVDAVMMPHQVVTVWVLILTGDRDLCD